MGRGRFQRFAAECVRAAIVLSAVLMLSSCQSGKPRMRMGAYFGSPIAMPFPSPENLSSHHYDFSLNEINGMLYTCKGGFIDIGHLREGADRTAYLARITHNNLMRGNKQFSFRVIEPSRYRIKVRYPENWDMLPVQEREKTANEVSIRLGQYLAHRSMIWHEIMTWYGFSIVGVFPENISSFSCEDTYSDVLGTHLGVQALRDNRRSFDGAMTQLIDSVLRELEVQPAKVARKAKEQVEGAWYTGGFYFFVHMKKHNFDTGLDDGLITPVLVPGICADAEPQVWPAPDLEFLSRYGFGIEIEIEPLIHEKGKIWQSIGLDKRESRIRPEVHFPEMLKAIQKADRVTRGF